MSDAIRRGATRNFHLPLPEALYRALREEATALGQPATAVARDVIATWLRERRKSMVREAVAAYAAASAGSAADLDPALESAGLELLRAKPRYHRSQ